MTSKFEQHQAFPNIEVRLLKGEIHNIKDYRRGPYGYVRVFRCKHCKFIVSTKNVICENQRYCKRCNTKLI